MHEDDRPQEPLSWISYKAQGRDRTFVSLEDLEKFAMIAHDLPALELISLLKEELESLMNDRLQRRSETDTRYRR